MPAAWKNFVAVKLPICILGIVVAIELSAMALSGAPLDRHPLDRLANGLASIRTAPAIALTGDSVTRELAKYYALDEDDQVLNLTTNKASGSVGVLLLWRRLSETVDTTPQHLMMAVTPEFLAYVPDPATYRTYVWSVFSRESERTFLADLGYPAFDDSRFPAIKSLQSSIYDPAIGWIFATDSPPRFGPTIPREDLPLEGPGGDAVPENRLLSRHSFDGTLGDIAARTMSALCAELAADDVSLTIAWAPTPESVRRSWISRGILERYQARIAGLDGCEDIDFLDINTLRDFPDHAFRDDHHLRWPGWINAYGLLLRDGAFPDNYLR